MDDAVPTIPSTITLKTVTMSSTEAVTVKKCILSKRDLKTPPCAVAMICCVTMSHNGQKIEIKKEKKTNKSI